MKKILLTIALILGINKTIQPSFFSRAFQSVKSTLTPGNLLAYTILPTISTGIAYHYAGKELTSQLSITKGELVNLVEHQEKLAKAVDALVPKPESSWLSSLGTPGAVIAATLAAYRFLQYGIGEVSSLMQIVGLINSLKNNVVQGSEIHEEQKSLPEYKIKSPRKLQPAQKKLRLPHVQ
jgi:hypothetical protein